MTDSSTYLKPSKGQRLQSFFKSPASKKYDKVLAESWEKAQDSYPQSSIADKDEDSDNEDLKKLTTAAPVTQEQRPRLSRGSALLNSAIRRPPRVSLSSHPTGTVGIEDSLVKEPEAEVTVQVEEAMGRR